MPTRPQLPLTLGQLDFWEEFQAHPDHAVSTVAHVAHLSGALDAEALASAITMMTAEADVLSLRFRAGDPPTQCVDPDCRPALRRLDLRAHPEPKDEARRLMQADIDRPLDLRTAPLSAIWLVRTGASDWQWYLRGHHIFLDGYAMALIERRVAQLYAHLARGGDPGRPFGRFAEFLREETDYRTGNDHQIARAYWRDYLRTGLAPAVLRKGSENYPAAPHSVQILLPHLSAPMRQAALRLDLGWPDLMIILTAMWLWQTPEDVSHQPQTERLVWLPFMGRLGSAAAGIPAMVLNILPLRVSFDPSATLAQTLAGMHGKLKTLRRHGRCRIEQIGRDAGLAGDQRLFFSPLINVMPFDAATFPGCEVKREVLAAGPGDGFNVTITASPRGEGLAICLDADPALTSRPLFEHHAAGLPRFLEQSLSAGPDTKLGALIEGAALP